MKLSIREFRKNLKQNLEKLQQGEIIELPYVSLMMYVSEELIDDFEEEAELNNALQEYGPGTT